MKLFEGFGGAHGTHGVPRRKPDSLKWEIRSTAETRREAVTLELWLAHLRGERPLGVITVREDGTCRWGGIDYDVYDADLLALVERVKKLGLPLVPVRSKSGGLHLFLFMKTWTSAASVQSALRDMAAQLGVAGSEIYPKQIAVLVERGDLGSWIIMPYFGSNYGGKLQDQVGIKKTGSEMSLVEFLGEAEAAAVGEEELAKFTRKRSARSGNGTGRAPRGSNGAHGGSNSDAPFGDGPPCLETLASVGVGRGEQNNALLMMGVYFRRSDPEGWRAQLEHAAHEYLSPPGSAEGTASVIRSLEKKEYRYTCKTEPMCSHCNVALCRTRTYGIGDDGDYPSLSGLSVLPSDPPLFFVDVDGKRVELSEDQLYHYVQFQKVCMRYNKMFSPMKQADWVMALKPFVESMEPLPMPEEVGQRGMLGELIEEFLTNRQRGDRMEELFSGRPVKNEDDGWYYFRLRDLMTFLSREGVRDAHRGRVSQVVRDLGGEDVRTYGGQRPVRAWRIPQSRVEEPPEVGAPRRREEGI